jgi:hypothetical protein
MDFNNRRHGREANEKKRREIPLGKLDNLNPLLAHQLSQKRVYLGGALQRVNKLPQPVLPGLPYRKRGKDTEDRAVKKPARSVPHYAYGPVFETPFPNVFSFRYNGNIVSDRGQRMRKGTRRGADTACGALIGITVANQPDVHATPFQFRSQVAGHKSQVGRNPQYKKYRLLDGILRTHLI